MKRPLTDEDRLERASVDGRVAFAMAAFIVAGAMVVLLDRVGAPERIVGALGPALGIAGLIAIGLLLRSMRISRFYAAGRAVPAPYAGLATAALGIGLAAPFAPPISGEASLYQLLAGLGAGLLLAAFVTGPLLRKTGAFSIPDLLSARFPSLSLRLGVIAVVSAAAALIALAGVEDAVRVLTLTTGLSRWSVAAVTGVTLALVTVPGGIGGVVWAANGAAGLLLVGLGMPLVLMAASGTAIPLPVIGDAALWGRAAARIGAWQGDLPARAITGGWPLTLAIALGVAALAPILTGAICCRSAGASARAGVIATLWSFVLVGLVAASMALSALAIDRTIAGQRPERLPDAAYAANARGLITLCGQNVASPAAARAACAATSGFAGTLRPQDIEATGIYLTIALPELQGFTIAFSGLVAAGIYAAGLVLAAAGFQALATALGHDAFYRVRDHGALTSRRLAVTRGILIAAITVLCFIAANFSFDPRAMIGLALAFSAATIAPLLAMILWPRATGADATLALLMGLFAAEAMIVKAGAVPTVEQLAFAAAVASATALATGVVASLLHRDAGQGSLFVASVLRGGGDVLDRDKGA